MNMLLKIDFACFVDYHMASPLFSFISLTKIDVSYMMILCAHKNRSIICREDLNVVRPF